MADVSLGGPYGEAEPFIPIRLVAGEGASQVARKGPFVLELSKASALKSAVPPLAEALGIPSHGVTFMQEGRTLELDKSLSENEITIPGARARREGEKVVLCFDTEYQVIQEMEKKARKAEEEVAMAEQQRLKEQKLKELKERKVLEEAEQEKQRKSKVVTAEANLHQQIEQHVGVNRERYQELLANPDPDVVKPRHYLEPATSEQEAAVKGLLEAAGAAKDIACAYWVHHEELRMRYERAKAGLQADSSRILKKESTTTNHVLNRKDLAFLGDFDRSVNEFCLWHGTGRLEGAAGICANGFDIAYVGSAVGTAWGHGFYFADSAATSMSYTGAGIRGGDACNGVRIMFLCRVLCGRVQELSAAPSQEQKEALTAKCLGPGGVFGAKSEVHSIYGGRFCYVCAHNHQVYPQMVLFVRDRRGG